MKLFPAEWDSYIIDKKYLSWLVRPEFIKKEGLIIIKSHYRRKTIPSNWLKSIQDHPNDIARMENTINHVHMSAITEDIKMQKKIGEHLIRIWRNKLKSQFPESRFTVRLIFDSNENEWELQLWTKRTQTTLQRSRKQ